MLPKVTITVPHDECHEFSMTISVSEFMKVQTLAKIRKVLKLVHNNDVAKGYNNLQVFEEFARRDLDWVKAQEDLANDGYIKRTQDLDPLSDDGKRKITRSRNRLKREIRPLLAKKKKIVKILDYIEELKNNA